MINIEKNKKLLEYNFYKIDAVAGSFVELKKKVDFLEVFEYIQKNKITKGEQKNKNFLSLNHKHNKNGSSEELYGSKENKYNDKFSKLPLKFFILGGGANVIFVKKKYDGLVVKISNTFTKWENKNRVEVGAGRNWDKFLATLQKKGFYEIQSLSAIPGSVGAAAFGNIGAFGTEVKKYIFGVWAFDIAKKEFVFLDNENLDFGYRDSYLKKNRENFVVYSVVFDFSPKFQRQMKEKYADGEYFSLAHFAKKHGLGKIKKSDIRKIITKMRHSVYPNLKKFPNVGSTFKNTEISKSQAKNILKKYPDMPNWDLDNGKVKIPTAFILDKVLGLNGKQFGNIKIDEKRPLFFTNMGGATGEEFLNLCTKIKKMAKEEIGVEIGEEVQYME